MKSEIAKDSIIELLRKEIDSLEDTKQNLAKLEDKYRQIENENLINFQENEKLKNEKTDLQQNIKELEKKAQYSKKNNNSSNENKDNKLEEENKRLKLKLEAQEITIQDYKNKENENIILQSKTIEALEQKLQTLTQSIKNEYGLTIENLAEENEKLYTINQIQEKKILEQTDQIKLAKENYNQLCFKQNNDNLDNNIDQYSTAPINNHELSDTDNNIFTWGSNNYTPEIENLQQHTMQINPKKELKQVKAQYEENGRKISQLEANNANMSNRLNQKIDEVNKLLQNINILKQDHDDATKLQNMQIGNLKNKLSSIQTKQAQELQQRMTTEMLETNDASSIGHQMTISATTTVIKQLANQQQIVHTAAATSGSDVARVKAQIWSSGFLGLSTHKSGASIDTTGGSIGGQMVFNNQNLLGAAFTLTKSSTAGSDRAIANSVVNLTNYIWSVYGAVNINNISLSATGIMGSGTGGAILSTGKKVEFQTPIRSASGIASYDFRRGKHSIIPAIKIDYIQAKCLDKDSKPLNQNGKKDDELEQTLNAQLSIKYAYNIAKEGMQIMPFAEIGLLRSIISTPGAWLTSVEDKTTQWFKSPRNALMLRPGITIKSNFIDFTAQYTFEKSKDYTSHSGSIKTLLKF